MGLRPIAAASALTLFLLLMALAGSGSPANATCVGPTGGIETCTGNANGGSAVFGASTVSRLDVNNLTSDLSQIALTGSGSSPSDPAEQHYTCAAPAEGEDADCTITPGVPKSAGVDSKPESCAGANCVAPPDVPLGGPTGNAGPTVEINYLQPGANAAVPNSGAVIGATDGAPGVLAQSSGSRGGNGGNGYVFTNGGDGHDGADGGNATVNANGAVKTTGDHAAGIVATSVAGNGGNGGGAYGIRGNAGDGGLGGSGGSATVNLNGGSVVTTGDYSVGIAAVSQGGGGGNGGGGGGLVFNPGGGSPAGSGGNATVFTAAGTSISTSGIYSHGIAAQSIGGGGGSSAGGFGLFSSSGGDGGNGGNGGVVTVVNNGSITTNNDNSQGILAQTIGGGGGDGGSNFGLFASGGSGSLGGYGYGDGLADKIAVGVTNSGAIVTKGQSSNGILAQSIGGGGGNGGRSGGLVALGGNGSSTTNGGIVQVTNTATGSIQTNGQASAGIFAQSIGGGGGNGGSSVGLFSAGGSGGAGGEGGLVKVINGGNIETGKNGLGSVNSAGIFAQSIGGGGGNGGGAVSGGVGFSVALGGKGGGGGDAGAVEVRRDAQNTRYSIITHGAQSDAVFAQSVGGGGGNGGFAASGTIGALALSMGGDGALGGKGGAVTVETAGTLTTSGDGSRGIFAQSVGGGGGNGGAAVAVAVDAVGAGFAAAIGIGGTGGKGGDASIVKVSSLSDIKTEGANAQGIFAQSVGGGGGNGGYSAGGALGGIGIAVNIGGSGGSGGLGGEVDVDSSGSIWTKGANSTGILAQSIGGGGGNGGFAVSVALGAGAASVALGGKGGSGSSGGNVTVDADGAGQFISTTDGRAWNLATEGKNAVGILAQSIGGGGGNGGFAGSLSAGGLVGIGVSLGGTAGGGGDAGKVTVNNGKNVDTQNNILTFEDGSTGILAQSVGGGGGNGGFAVALSGSGSFGAAGGSAAVSLGGSGGDGGIGEAVSVTNYGNIATFGKQSAGILAQSLGGGGGNGGFSVSGTFTTGAFGASVAIGGSGGLGQDGGAVTVTSTGDIETHGDQSAGLFAQSVGGGGGNGGFAGAGAITLQGAAVGLGLGGSGDGGGNGNTVGVASTGNVTTSGNQSVGILAQSVGGGGGNGGSTLALAVGQQAGVSVALGGAGGSGGTGGGVTVTSKGDIATGADFDPETMETVSGTGASSILAQSIGGGGGNGGFALSVSGGKSLGVSVSLGGSGAGGGKAGAVGVDSDGDVSTAFDNSSAIFAQSVGGGGGNGGFSGALAIAVDGGAVGVSLGGSGGLGGSGDAVTVGSQGGIVTLGANSNGIFAQSLGGGGGNGGFSVAASGAGKQVSASVSLGGGGGAGGISGLVTVDHAGTIATADNLANGILAQSIAGGGGNGGFSVAGNLTVDGAGGASVSVGGSGGKGQNAGAVIVNSNVGTTLVDNAATIHTEGGDANGIFAQSVGGGGGNGGFSGALSVTGPNAKAAVAVSIGGFGDGGGNGSTVNVTSVDNILTEGDGANGILAQSVGGGGGNGGFSFAAAVNGSLGKSDGAKAAISASLGGLGGAGGDGDAVTVDSTGIIQTQGKKAYGILAQSVGGGGGNGGLSVTASLSGGEEGNQISASVGGFGGGAGVGADVVVTHSGSILTEDDQSVGIFAQSVGGGGGNGGLSIAGTIAGKDAKSLSASLGGFGGEGSDGGSVKVDNTGAISTAGVEAHAIQAQSIGGGGGNGGMAIAATIGVLGEGTNVNASVAVGGFGGKGGTAGKVTVDNDGLLSTTGDGAFGIFAQSIGGGGGSGGNAITGVLGLGGNTEGTQVNITVAVGGLGGSGNVGGNVKITQDGGIATEGIGAAGIFAQSIGGGGGTGGRSNSISLQLGPSCKPPVDCDAAKNSPNWNLQATVGGAGGTGNIAGIVDVANLDLILTHGEKSAGIVAQSIGGGGGTGGDAYVGLGGLVSIPLLPTDPLLFLKPFSAGSFKRSASIAIGGSGGTGGDGGTVIVTNTGKIVTEGQTSDGIHAQSIGAGGGDGGDGNAGMLGTIALGGSGGASGNGGAVTVTNGASDGSQASLALIETFGGVVLDEDGDVVDSNAETGRSAGIFAQSVGGGGGTGGGAGALLAIGGNGEAAGNGGTVTIDNYGGILTHADDSVGILAQSIGGGGGSGGSVGLALVGVGGWGAAAGEGGIVDVSNAAMIETRGIDSHAIFAQSVGGGGGNGGGKNAGKFTDKVPALVLVGGGGGASGSGGSVTVTNASSLHTIGAGADGINAQSIGGGGGSAGRAFGLITVGGDTGATGNGGHVTVNNTIATHIDPAKTTKGTILVEGYGAHGIFAQSVGGGGGNGGGGLVDGLNSGSIDIGGSGKGGSGGTVDVTNAGQISTLGAASVAIFAQSIGGGGGNGAMTGGTALTGASAFDFTIGGAGGVSGNGGDVTVTNEATGLIITKGYGSTGIMAQSVGGGGGTGGITYVTSPGGTPSIALAVGGSGGAGGNGGKVTVVNDGSMLIEGDNSVAIFAQSVGGGGGSGGAATAVALGATAILGGDGATGVGGDVEVTSTGSIQLTGKGSVGIFAQSVGGGGGVVTAGTDGIVEATQNAGDGKGGKVTISGNASIYIEDANSVGVFAQSVGGGGGVGGSDGNYLGLDQFSGASAPTFALFAAPAGFMGTAGGAGAGEDVTITQTKNVAVTGDGSFGILAQSVGGEGEDNGDINVTIAMSADPLAPVWVLGGSGSGAGVGFKDGKTNLLTNHGVVASINGIDGYAMRATGGDDTFDNAGAVFGSVALGGGLNTFNNRFDAVYLMGETVDLGLTGKFANAGYMSPGDWDRVLTTTLTGNLEQADTGAYLLDLDLADTTDRIDVSGTAKVDGLVVINIMNPGAARTGSTDYVIIHTEGGVTEKSLELDTIPSAVAQYKLLYPLDPMDVVLNVDINYARGGLTENQTAVGSAINAIQTDLTSPNFTQIAAALFYVPTLDALGAVYDSISGEGVSGFQQPEFDMNSTFLAAMTSQADSWRIGIGTDPSSQSFAPKPLGYVAEPGKNPAFAALEAVEERRWKIWATVGGNSGNVNGDPTVVGSADLTYKGGSLAAGLDYQLDPDTLMGFALGGGAGSFSVPDRETSGNIVGGHLGAYASKKWGQLYANGAVSLDVYDNTTTRQATVPGSDAPINPVQGFSERWESDFLSGGFGAKVETGWRQPVAGLGAVTGFAGLQFASLSMQGFSETSPNGDVLGLDYASRTITSLPSSLGVQLDTVLGLGDDRTIQPWARAAWLHEFNPDRSVNPTFLSAPGYPFVVQGAAAAEDAVAVNAGFKMNWGPDTSFFATFDGKFASNVQTYGGNAGFQVRW